MTELINMSEFKEELDYNKFHNTYELITYIQQVILKSEWKRIIKEIEQGKKINDSEVAEIFNQVAMNIDEKKYKCLKNKHKDDCGFSDFTK